MEFLLTTSTGKQPLKQQHHRKRLQSSASPKYFGSWSKTEAWDSFASKEQCCYDYGNYTKSNRVMGMACLGCS